MRGANRQVGIGAFFRPSKASAALSNGATIPATRPTSTERAPRPSSFTLPPFRLLPASPDLSRVVGSACACVDSPATA